MGQQSVRPAAVAGSWYPSDPGALRRAVTQHLHRVPDDIAPADAHAIAAVIAPHAGLTYSGPVAAHAYKHVAGNPYEVIGLVGPSHFVAFEGVAATDADAFETPLGDAVVDRPAIDALTRSRGVVHVHPAAHRREHSLEMQLPFLRLVLPDVPIVPLLMGFQTRSTIVALAEALALALAGRRALLVASTDLSHFFDAATAARLDQRVVDCVARFDAAALLDLFEQYPEHERGRFVACGGGPMIATMMAARRLGAEVARVLRRADSGDVSGDRCQVVGYMAAAMFGGGRGDRGSQRA